MVEDMGGVFTGGHIANAQTWKETWSGKHKAADRIIIFVTPEYYKYFTAALKFEHGRIYELAAAEWQEGELMELSQAVDLAMNAAGGM